MNSKRAVERSEMMNRSSLKTVFNKLFSILALRQKNQTKIPGKRYDFTALI